MKFLGGAAELIFTSVVTEDDAEGVVVVVWPAGETAKYGPAEDTAIDGPDDVTAFAGTVVKICPMIED